MIVCPSCGKWYNEEYRVCPSCGSPAQSAEDYVRGQYRLGLGLLNYGRSATDRAAAVGYLKRAARAKLTEAEYMLGFCYRYGKGVSADAKEAAKWYRRALKHGEESAALALKFLGEENDPGEDAEDEDEENEDAVIAEEARPRSAPRIQATPVKTPAAAPADSGKKCGFPEFSEQYILDLLNVYVTFQKGKRYFQEVRVHDLSWNGHFTLFTSRVQGRELYRCELIFCRDRLISHECNCLAHENYTGPCKHIVATMLDIRSRRLQTDR